MHSIKSIALLAFAAPAISFAQVGPNPAVNGSLDPTVGKTGDAVTAPADAPIGPAVPENAAADRTGVADAAPGDDTASAPDAASDTKKTTAPTSESARKPR